MRTSSKTHYFRGNACSKTNSLRELVDSREQYIWRIQVIGSWLLYSFCFVCSFVFFNLRAISEYRPPGAYIWRGDLTEGFLRYLFGGLIHGGAYFRNFTVALQTTGVLLYNLWAILVCGMCFISGA